MSNFWGWAIRDSASTSLFAFLHCILAFSILLLAVFLEHELWVGLEFKWNYGKSLSLKLSNSQTTNQHFCMFLTFMLISGSRSYSKSSFFHFNALRWSTCQIVIVVNLSYLSIALYFFNRQVKCLILQLQPVSVPICFKWGFSHYLHWIYNCQMKR